jgi:hypothetical protein
MSVHKLNFGRSTKADVLQRIQEGDFKALLFIGRDESDEIFFDHGNLDKKELLWLIEIVKLNILDIE